MKAILKDTTNGKIILESHILKDSNCEIEEHEYFNIRELIKDNVPLEIKNISDIYFLNGTLIKNRFGNILEVLEKESFILVFQVDKNIGIFIRREEQTDCYIKRKLEYLKSKFKEKYIININNNFEIKIKEV